MPLYNGNGQELSGASGLRVLSYQTSVNLVMNIITAGGAAITSKDTYVNCTYEIRQGVGGPVVFSDTGRIRGRGNSTWDFPKKPYKVKLDHKLPVLGMSKSKDWALLANWIDPSKIRNAVVYQMSYCTDLPWAPRSRMVDVYLNGNYKGFYQLIESVEVDDARVKIATIKNTDTMGAALTGGYVMEVDVRIDENNETGWWTRLGVPIIFDTPDGSIKAQYDYMRAYTQAAEDALFADDFPNNNWRDYFDVNSWIDWYLLTELVCSNDSGFGASVKITKQRGDTHLYLGPPWDYDSSFGITFFIPHPTNGWWTRVGATWIARMLEDPAFVATMKQRWVSFTARMDAFGMVNWIHRLEEQVASRVNADFVAWPDAPTSAPDIVNYLTARRAWIDNELAQAGGKTDAVPPATPTNFVASSTTATTVSFTWDDAGTASGTGVVGYRIRQDGTIAALTRYPYSDTINAVTISGLSSGTQYSFTLECRDAAGNWSTTTIPLIVTTL